MKDKLIKLVIVALIAVNFLMAGIAWYSNGVGVPTLAAALIACLVVALGTQGITLNKYVVLDDTAQGGERGAPANVGKTKEQKIIGVTLVLLGIMIALTAVSVYITFVNEKNDPVVQTTQTQQVSINVNTGEDTADRLDLNRATRQELEALPDIGPVLACRIMEARPFYSVEELKDIEGIGETIFVKVRGLVKVD